jgi:hypothetical protein
MSPPDNGAHYKMSSKGIWGRANQDGAWGDKGDYQKGTGASGAGMSPPEDGAHTKMISKGVWGRA